MTISSLFSVNGSTTVQAHSVSYGATVTFVIQSVSGIENIAWEIEGTSKSDQAALAISLSGTPNGATATVTMPSDPGDGLGRSFIMKLTVSNQRETSTTRRVFGRTNSAGIVPVAANEELYRNATHGYTDVFNQALNAIGGAAGSSGQLLYNNSGSIDGASGISVVGSETSLAFGTNPAASGVIRGPNNALLVAGRNAANNGDVAALSVDSGNHIVLGGTSSTSNYYNVATSGEHIFQVNSTDILRLSATALDMNGKTLQEIGTLDHDGSTAGFFGTTPVSKPTGVAVSAAGIHAALVTLGLIAA